MVFTCEDGGTKHQAHWEGHREGNRRFLVDGLFVEDCRGTPSLLECELDVLVGDGLACTLLCELRFLDLLLAGSCKRERSAPQPSQQRPIAVASASLPAGTGLTGGVQQVDLQLGLGPGAEGCSMSHECGTGSHSPRQAGQVQIGSGLGAVREWQQGRQQQWPARGGVCRGHLSGEAGPPRMCAARCADPCSQHVGLEAVLCSSWTTSLQARGGLITSGQPTVRAFPLISGPVG